jgi:AcrR family transcriptional regulator
MLAIRRAMVAGFAAARVSGDAGMTKWHTGPGRPKVEQAALITDRIVDSAWQVLLDSGPEHFTIDRVTRIAHVSKQTIYARFSGKLDLLQTVLVTRVNTLFAEMCEIRVSGDIQSSFADLAHRSVKSMTTLEGRMLERLVDWIDSKLTEDESTPTRVALYEQLHEYSGQLLLRAMAQWGIIIDNIPEAASYWLDGLLGHVRGCPLERLQAQEWPAKYARYFLRAVCQRTQA